jgi:NADPH:quinone reductase-like Zn-dependent oxidoreductase
VLDVQVRALARAVEDEPGGLGAGRLDRQDAHAAVALQVVVGTIAQARPDVTRLADAADRRGVLDDVDDPGLGYVAAPESTLSRKPRGLGFEQAAAVPISGLIAWSALHQQGRVKPGDHILVNGACGGVGTFVVQLAKAAGARVTAVDAAGKLAALGAIGADRVIDYASDDFTRGSERYDLIVDIPGNHSFAECRRVLTHDGTYVLIGHGRWLGSLPRVLPLVAQAPFRRQLPPVDFSTPDKAAVLAELARRLQAGELRPVIERTYPLSDAADAIRHLQTARVTGKILLAMPTTG